MSAADNETIAQQLPRALDDACSSLTDARAALENAASVHAGAIHEHTGARSAARAAGLAGTADAETRASDERRAEWRAHIARGEETRAKEAYRDAIASLEDSASKARRWLADAREGGASAESVTAAERAIDAAERRATVERLHAEERGWIRPSRPAAEPRAAVVVESSKISGAGARSAGEIRGADVKTHPLCPDDTPVYGYPDMRGVLADVFKCRIGGTKLRNALRLGRVQELTTPGRALRPGAIANCFTTHKGRRKCKTTYGSLRAYAEWHRTIATR